MLARLEQLFDQFATDFSQFSGRKIADRFFCAPYLTVSDDGKLTNYDTLYAVAEHFQSVLDTYREKGITVCRYQDLSFQIIGEKSVCAQLTWQLLNDDSEIVLTWRESYTLVDQTNQLRIYSSADFAPR